MKILFTVLLISIFPNVFLSQKIEGKFIEYKNQTVYLYKCIGVITKLVDSTIIDSNGHFYLENSSIKLKGMGYLKIGNNITISLVLGVNDIFIENEHLSNKESFLFKDEENKIYNKYIIEHKQRDNVLAGWRYLLNEYNVSKLFSNDEEETSLIRRNIEEIESEDANFINSLEDSLFVKYVLPLEKLIRDVPVSAKYLTSRIPHNIKEFRELDYSDLRLYNSGLLDDVIQSHYWLIENSGKPLDSVFIEMNKSTDFLLESLQNDEEILNEVTDYLFDLLEKHSLFKASEYLALRVLTLNSCTLKEDLAKQLETYRAMKVGNEASNILFSGHTIKNGIELQNDLTLNDLQADYKLVMFGASWCPKCVNELPKVKSLYSKWQQKGLEVVFVSLDNNEEEFLNFVNDFPWLSTCEYKQWDTRAAQDYYVFSTPSLFLLDNNNKILLRPHSIDQVNSWVEFYLK